MRLVPRPFSWQGPTIAPIFSSADMGLPEGHAYYAATICVPKSRLYASVKELRKVRLSALLPTFHQSGLVGHRADQLHTLWGYLGSGKLC